MALITIREQAGGPTGSNAVVAIEGMNTRRCH